MSTVRNLKLTHYRNSAYRPMRVTMRITASPSNANGAPESRMSSRTIHTQATQRHRRRNLSLPISGVA